MKVSRKRWGGEFLHLRREERTRFPPAMYGKACIRCALPKEVRSADSTLKSDNSATPLVRIGKQITTSCTIQGEKGTGTSGEKGLPMVAKLQQWKTKKERRSLHCRVRGLGDTVLVPGGKSYAEGGKGGYIQPRKRFLSKGNGWENKSKR